MSKKPRTLLDDLESLVHRIVREVGRDKKLPDGTVVKPDVLDQVRAADLGIRFLARKTELAPGEESQFERDLASYHDQGDGGATTPRRTRGRPDPEPVDDEPGDDGDPDADDFPAAAD